MTRLLLAFIALVVLMPGSARAGDEPFGLGFIWHGMALAEARAMALPEDLKLHCSGDRNLPKKLAAEDAETLAMPPKMAKAKMRRCGVFAHDPQSSVWHSVRITLADGAPAEFWFVTIPDGTGGAGTERVAQIQLWRPADMFQTTLQTFSQFYGPPKSRTEGGATWENQAGEAILAWDGRDGIHVILIDKILQPMLQSQLR